MNKRAKDLATKFGIDSSNHEALQMLIAFAAQSPGLEFGNYGDMASYAKESREIGKDWKRFVSLVAEAMAIGVPDDLLTTTDNGNGRLTWKNGGWDYTTGQYWCVEYRPAACALLERAIRMHRQATYKPSKVEDREYTLEEMRDIAHRAGSPFFSNRAPGEHYKKLSGNRIEVYRGQGLLYRAQYQFNPAKASFDYIAQAERAA